MRSHHNRWFLAVHYSDQIALGICRDLIHIGFQFLSHSPGNFSFEAAGPVNHTKLDH